LGASFPLISAHIDIYLHVGIMLIWAQLESEVTAMRSNKTRGQAKATLPTVCDQLREAIEASGKTHYRIGKDARVKPEIVARFARRERDIRAETFAKIAAALGMELRSEGN
jgi:hypothetical protein